MGAWVGGLGVWLGVWRLIGGCVGRFYWVCGWIGVWVDGLGGWMNRRVDR